MNYFRSEYYRTIRVKSFYLLSLVWLGFLTLLCYLFTSLFNEYATWKDYNETILGFISSFSIFLIMLISNFFTGKKQDPLKQTISFGISRGNIYLNKFLFSTILLFLLLFLSEAISSGFGLIVFSTKNFEWTVFQIKFLNMLPLLLSSLAFCQWLNFRRVNDVVTIISVLGIYYFSGDVMELIDKLFFNKIVVTPYLPSTLLGDALYSTKFEPKAFFIGAFLLVFFYLIGLQRFNRKDVA